MYKAPPPEISSEQFYETDRRRGFARGFSIQTVGPLPTGWAGRVIADGHWGRALRDYKRDYNHWHTLGAPSELLPLAENRVTIASGVNDQNGIPVARMDDPKISKRVLGRREPVSDGEPRGHPRGETRLAARTAGSKTNM
jgi:hypothetical protein